jgi:FkbM family methyltransferase
LNLAGVPADRWYGRLIRWPLRWIPRGTTVRVLQGPLRSARWITGSHTDGCWVGTYELARQRAFARLVTSGMVVYDLGANVGFYTLLASRLAGPTGSVVAVEPLPRNLDYLRRHLALNRCGNVTIVEAAVSDWPGRSAMQAVSSAGAQLNAAGTIAVRTTTLDALVFEEGLRPPSLLKLDVEGEEARVLEGARRTLTTYRPIVLLSTHSAALRQQCHRALGELGYGIQAEDGRTAVVDADEVIAMGGKSETRG